MKLILNDCVRALKEMKENSIDSLVCDPPAGISFMGKNWDSDKGGRDHWVKWMSSVMQECIRVMKPGAHGLVWALPRTSHWTATALEDAGFEIRDVITHLFGSGFPKSMDISKVVDAEVKYGKSGMKDIARATSEREVISRKVDGKGLAYPKVSANGGANGSFGLNGHSLSELYEMRNSGVSKTKDGHNVEFAIARGEQKIEVDPHMVTVPSTPEAKQWEGWGTALKPAAEMWVLVRKPLSEKTVAKNVLLHGTGGINIDASRIGTTVGQTLGRFPANLVLSSPADEELDLQAGDSVSRFFYCAKASKSDKGAENTHPTVKASKLMAYLIKLITPPNGLVLDPFMGSASTGVAAVKEGFDFVGIEMDPEYFNIAQKRIFNAFPEFKKQYGD